MKYKYFYLTKTKLFNICECFIFHEIISGIETSMFSSGSKFQIFIMCWEKNIPFY